MDLKITSKFSRCFQFTLCVMDEVINYLVTIPVYQSRSEVGNIIIKNLRTKLGCPEIMISDQNNAFMSSLITYSLKRLDIKIEIMVL